MGKGGMNSYPIYSLLLIMVLQLLATVQHPT